MENTQQEPPSLTEFELGLRWHEAPSTITFWRQGYPKKIPPHFKVGGSTRYLLSEIEKFEAENPKTNRTENRKQCAPPEPEKMPA